MRKRELEERVRKLQYEVRLLRDQQVQMTDGLERHGDALSAHDQRLRTTEHYLLRGNSSPNMARRAPDAVTVHPPRKAE